MRFIFVVVLFLMTTYSPFASENTSKVGDLIMQLKDKDPIQRAEAARLLGSFQDSKIITSLAEAVNDKDIYVVRFSLISLGEFDSQNARNILLSNLRSEDENRKMFAILGLSKKAHPSITKPLIDAINNETNWHFKGLMAQILAEINNVEARQALKRYKETCKGDQCLVK